jgi:hypothetical protein
LLDGVERRNNQSSRKSKDLLFALERTTPLFKKTNVIQSAASKYVAPPAQQPVQPEVEGPAFPPDQHAGCPIPRLTQRSESNGSPRF